MSVGSGSFNQDLDELVSMINNQLIPCFNEAQALMNTVDPDTADVVERLVSLRSLLYQTQYKLDEIPPTGSEESVSLVFTLVSSLHTCIHHLQPIFRLYNLDLLAPSMSIN